VGNIGDLQIGRLSQKGNTATEVLQTLQEGNIKFNYQATTIKDEFIELLQALYDHYYQHMPFCERRPICRSPMLPTRSQRVNRV